MTKRTIDNTKFPTGDCLFGSVKIQKDVTDVKKYKYSGYGVCYNFNDSFTHGSNQNARNLIIFGVDSSNHKKIDSIKFIF